ncbi:7 transmembrane receptor [Trichinella spiralis]|uniref:7 transmembrane receptor n=1 Tax=Trichinella spiralis TaxID=6334 RepID=UPI0001EFE78D|nr:7 transmembrane receptor [Trichinella spiralis]
MYLYAAFCSSRVLKIQKNFKEQPATISHVLQLHTEKCIRNVRPMLMEEQRECVRAKDTKTRRMMVLNGTGLFFLTPVSPVPLYQTSFLTSINQSSDHQFIIKATSLLNPVPIDPVLASFSNQGVYHARWVEIWGLRQNTEYTRLD